MVKIDIDRLTKWLKMYSEMRIQVVKMEKKKADDKIFQAAMEEFLEKGFTGARMQAIANKAGINKALLHYYFKSKDELYKAVFKKVFTEFFSSIIIHTDQSLGLEDYLKAFIGNYIDTISQRRHMFKFLIWELENEGQNIAEILNSLSDSPAPVRNFPIFKKLEEAISIGQIRPVNTFHLMISIIGMCLYPFIAHNIVRSIWRDADLYSEKFREERKEEIFNLVWFGIQKEG